MVNTRVSSEFEPQSTTTSRTAMRYQHAARGRSAELAWLSRVSPRAVTPIEGNGLRERSGPDAVTDSGAGP